MGEFTEAQVFSIFNAVMDARDAYDEGRECKCLRPDVRGKTLCHKCKLLSRRHVEADRERRESPHAFDGSRSPIVCAVCGGFDDDPRHIAPAPATPEEDTDE